MAYVVFTNRLISLVFNLLFLRICQLLDFPGVPFSKQYYSNNNIASKTILKLSL